MRTTLSGGPSASIRLDPPVAGIVDSSQASYICQGVVNGIAQVINWRYDVGLSKIIFFMPDAAGAPIPNGVFEAHVSDCYETA